MVRSKTSAVGKRAAEALDEGVIDTLVVGGEQIGVLDGESLLR